MTYKNKYYWNEETLEIFRELIELDESFENIKKEVELALTLLHQKLDFLKHKVDELCKHSGCFKTIDIKGDPKEKK